MHYENHGLSACNSAGWERYLIKFSLKKLCIIMLYDICIMTFSTLFTMGLPSLPRDPELEVSRWAAFSNVPERLDRRTNGLWEVYSLAMYPRCVYSYVRFSEFF
ncbi:hypothetical protein BKA82DRAFT_739459 [Pisolithus tinctorius]|uniref:Uncharacterized protein n=1 Tax=Pisolithus tinctorius Marx 270 TaxID=870435 RepID=A0A0C3IW14_PISTI|nr:hypothetical protein BKA82DRAFT_739459 [Pisolithus tinctorius]KIO01028.1 hypothetical protein M404DRAFT_739459 [Pisolithus tinctorius Marx 270]